VRQLTELAPGHRIGPYEIGEELGRGGIAIVYRARHLEIPGLGPLAIKIANRSNEQRAKRFIREFERLRVVTIPGVTRVVEAGATDELLWFAMEAINGVTMDKCIGAAGGIEARATMATKTGARLCEILSGIHRMGFIHRDIKPSNVMVDKDGKVNVLDFGLVRLQERGDTLTRTGRLVGTVAFMSPEQTTGIPLTAQTDVFSAGLVLYEGIVGRRERPHKQEEWLGRMCLQRVTPLCIREPGIPRTLSALVDAMLELDPHSRPTAAQCALRLRGLLHGGGVADWPDPPTFVGRKTELDTLIHTFDMHTPPLVVLMGPTGSGRKRLLEQVQRRALLYGTPRVTGTCRPEVAGGAILEILQQLLATHADPEWRRQVTGPDVGALMAMWPTLPLKSPPPTLLTPSLEAVASAAAATIHRALDTVGLMVVLYNLDRVDGLTARTLQALVRHPPERLAIFGTYDDRWASSRAQRLVRYISERGMGTTLTLPDLTGAQATELANSLNDDTPGEPSPAGSPQRAREHGLNQLAQRRGETLPLLPASVVLLAVALRPLPAAVLVVLDIDIDTMLEAKVIQEITRGCYGLANQTLHQRALALLPDRATAEDAVGDALARGGLGAERWADVATHMLRGKKPHRALGAAIRAAVHAVNTGQLAAARNWLMAIDPIPRDRSDPSYQALRFELAWCRAYTSVSTDLARIRADLVAQARERASGPSQHLRVDALEADLWVRQGRVNDAIARCREHARSDLQPMGIDPAELGGQAIRILLSQARVAEAKAVLGEVPFSKNEPSHLLAMASVAYHQGQAKRSQKLCKQGIAQAHPAHHASVKAELMLTLGLSLLDLGQRAGATQSIFDSRDMLMAQGLRARLAEANLAEAALAYERGHPTAARVLIEPTLAVAQSLRLDRVQSCAWSLRLQVAAALGDSAAAKDTMNQRPETQIDAAGWRHATARWWWSQKLPEQAVAYAVFSTITTPTEVHIAIDAARLYLTLGDRQKASAAIAPALDCAKAHGYRELFLLASLVADAIAPGDEAVWRSLHYQARGSAWMELSLGCLALEGARWRTVGDNKRSRASYKALLERTQHLGDAFHQAVASMGLRQ
jgi:hypothetical protein